ncbi:MAG: DUF1893 domain-containing protein [Ruminococcaceae bacterium]|nr:DUF1893 domain-containing protein [Oscillospiraceae bacterium]
MHQDLERAKEAMELNGYTCVITFDSVMFKSNERGVQPLLDWLYSGNKYSGWRLCDKVVGKAAAYLHIILGVREIYAEVISQSAKELLEENNITVNAGEIVPAILNETKDAPHPLETVADGITDINDSVIAIEMALRRMNKK